jgi:hypothetical protein
MKSFKSFTGKARPKGTSDVEREDFATNPSTSAPNSSDVSDSEGKEPSKSLSDNPLLRWRSKWWPRQPQRTKDPTISQDLTLDSHKNISQDILKETTTTSKHAESGTLDPKETAREARRDKAILVTENSIEIVGLVKIAADMTSVSGPLKATCGVTERVLVTIKVDRRCPYFLHTIPVAYYLFSLRHCFKIKPLGTT